MLVVRSPLRVSFVGGGTDIDYFYKLGKGNVISTSIQQYVYIYLNKSFLNQYKLNYSQTEIVQRIVDIKHPLIREILKNSNVNDKLEIAAQADIPANGTGLGSSSAFSAGLIKAIYDYKNKKISKKQLALATVDIEINKCKSPIGKQDQYASCFGGLNRLTFYSNESVNVNKINIQRSDKKIIEDSVFLVFSGYNRSASNVLSNQKKLIKKNQKKIELLLGEMNNLVDEFEKSLKKLDIKSMANIIFNSWKIKMQYSGNDDNEKLIDFYNFFLKQGAYGGKILGAGQGGFFIFLAPPQIKRKIIKNNINKFKFLDFKFDQKGTMTIYNSNEIQ